MYEGIKVQSHIGFFSKLPSTPPPLSSINLWGWGLNIEYGNTKKELGANKNNPSSPSDLDSIEN